MIFIDRIIRYMMKDYMLPILCYANKKDFLCPHQKCDFRIYCKKPPNGSVPAYQLPKSNNNVFKYMKNDTR